MPDFDIQEALKANPQLWTRFSLTMGDVYSIVVSVMALDEFQDLRKKYDAEVELRKKAEQYATQVWNLLHFLLVVLVVILFVCLFVCFKYLKCLGTRRGWAYQITFVVFYRDMTVLIEFESNIIESVYRISGRLHFSGPALCHISQELTLT